MNVWDRYAGYVVSEIPDASGVIEVYCPELLPLKEDTLTVVTKTIELKIVDAVKGTFTKQIRVSDVIRCHYRSIGLAHYCSVPQVVPGEKIYVETHRGSGIYYWTPTGDTVHLRTADVLTLSIAAKPDQTDAAMNADNAYQLKFDAVKQEVSITTSTAIGEPCKLAFTMSAKTGIIALKAGNSMIAIDGQAAKIILSVQDSENNMAGITIDATTVRVVCKTFELMNWLISTASQMIIKPILSCLGHVSFKAGTSGCTSG